MIVWRFLIFTQLGRAILLALAVLAGALGIYAAGKRGERKQAVQRTINAYIETRRKLDEVKGFSNVETARDYLRSR